MRGVLHGAGKGCHDLEPHKVEEDDREVRQRFCIRKIGNEGLGAHIVGKALRTSKPDAAGTHHQHDKDFNNCPAVHDPFRIGNGRESQQCYAPNKDELECNLDPQRQLDAPQRVNDARRHAGKTCDPQGEINPIAPGAASAPFVTQTFADPIVQAAA